MIHPSHRLTSELHPIQNHLLLPMHFHPNQNYSLRSMNFLPSQSFSMVQHGDGCKRYSLPSRNCMMPHRECPTTKVAAREIPGKNSRFPFPCPCPKQPSLLQIVSCRSRIGTVHRCQVQRRRLSRSRRSARRSSSDQSNIVNSQQDSGVDSSRLTFSVTTLSNVSSVNSVEICLPRWAHQPVL